MFIRSGFSFLTVYVLLLHSLFKGEYLWTLLNTYCIFLSEQDMTRLLNADEKMWSWEEGNLSSLVPACFCNKQLLSVTSASVQRFSAVRAVEETSSFSRSFSVDLWPLSVSCADSNTQRLFCKHLELFTLFNNYCSLFYSCPDYNNHTNTNTQRQTRKHKYTSTHSDSCTNCLHAFQPQTRGLCCLWLCILFFSA